MALIVDGLSLRPVALDANYNSRNRRYLNVNDRLDVDARMASSYIPGCPLVMSWKLIVIYILNFALMRILNWLGGSVENEKC